jgi:hypothetical protein
MLYQLLFLPSTVADAVLIVVDVVRLVIEVALPVVDVT